MSHAWTKVICITGIGMLGVLPGLLPFGFFIEEDVGLHLLYILRGVDLPPPEVVLISLNPESARILDFPPEPRKWPRSVHGRLVNRLMAVGVRAIAFDLIFSDPQAPENDLAFANASRDAGNVVLTQLVASDTMPLLDARGEHATDVTIETIVRPIAPLAAVAAAEAPFPLPKIPVRLNKIFLYKPGEGETPTLPVVVFHVFARDMLGEFVRVLGRNAPFHGGTLSAGHPFMGPLVPFIQSVHAIFVADPTVGDRMHAFLGNDEWTASMHPHRRNLLMALTQLHRGPVVRYLNFYGPAGTLQTIPYHAILSPASETDFLGKFKELKDKIVFVGQTQSARPIATDGFHTAFSQKNGSDISGVEIAATAVANFIENKSVRPLGMWTQVLMLGAWGIAVTWICFIFPVMASAAVLFLLGVGYLLFASISFSIKGIWHPLVIPLAIQMPIGFLFTLAWKYQKEAKAKQAIREAFGYFLPNSVIDRISRNSREIQSGGQLLHGICLFTDAERYTSLSEALDPERLTRLMNRYYEAIFTPIKAYDGLILQVVGDSILSIWTSPEPDPVLKRKACQAALAIAESVECFNQESDPFQLPTRIGIHAGCIRMGNVGAMDHYEYRPVGDIVNTASRLEGLNKYLKTRVLVSQEVLESVEDFFVRCLGKFVFAGKSNPVTVFELMGKKDRCDDRWMETCECFSKGLAQFQSKRWDRAGDAFRQALSLDGEDGPSTFYLRINDAYRQSPPRIDWDGSVHMVQK